MLARSERELRRELLSLHDRAESVRDGKLIASTGATAAAIGAYQVAMRQSIDWWVASSAPTITDVIRVRLATETRDIERSLEFLAAAHLNAETRRLATSIIGSTQHRNLQRNALNVVTSTRSRSTSSPIPPDGFGAMKDGAGRAELLLALTVNTTQAVRRDAHLAERNATSTVLLMVSLIGAAIIASVAVALKLGRTITSGLGRLEAHARALIEGDELSPSMHEHGPKELVMTVRTINRLTEALVVVRQQADALAAGDIEHPSLRASLPGPLGRSVQQAVGRLTESILINRELRDRLSHSASHDPLTGLVNRSALWDVLDNMLREPEPNGAVIFVDLDSFKAVNDSYGHLAGDRVLRHVAAVLQSCVRGTDRLGRFGGDEFVIVCTSETTVTDAESLARRIVDRVADGRLADFPSVRIGASVGVALVRAGDSPASLLARADAEAYRAKGLGRGTVCIERVGA